MGFSAAFRKPERNKLCSGSAARIRTAGCRRLPASVSGEEAYDGFSFVNEDGGDNVIRANGCEKLKPGSRK